MEKKNYSAPKMEQVKMEAEMPVICASGAPSGNIDSLTTAVGVW